MTDSAQIRRLASLGLDGGRGSSGQIIAPDGYLTHAELVKGVRMLRTAILAAMQPEAQREERDKLDGLRADLHALVGMMPAARHAGDRGVPYMSDEFYALGLKESELALAIKADALGGDANGIATQGELAAWVAKQGAQNAGLEAMATALSPKLPRGR